jgi:hypothetical protein
MVFAAGNVMDSPQISVEPPTFSNMGFQVLYGGDDNRNASIGLRYRTLGSATWRSAQPLIRVPVERVHWKSLPRQFAGSIFDLRPGVNYEYELNISDPDGFSQTVFGTAATRAMPAPPINPRNIPVNSVATLQAAVSGAQPGDIISVQPGVYATQLVVSSSGTEANPIIIRGTANDAVVLDGQDCFCNVIEVYASNIRIESLSIRNAFQAVRYYGPVSGNQFTRNIVTNVEKGVNGQAGQGQAGFLIADNVFHGRAPYGSVREQVPDSYAFQIFGSNHIFAHNQIKGFFDGMRLFGGGNRNVDIYGNDIQFSADDGIELDDSEGNIRVLRNRVMNVASGISTQPQAGGPAYVMRNVVVNPWDEQIKFHANSGPPSRSPSGVYVYQNTFVSGTRGLSMNTPAPGFDSDFRNNIFHGPAVGLLAVAWDGPAFGLSFDYNGYFPDGNAYWNWQGSYVSYANLAAAKAGGLVEGNGRALSGNVFLSGLTGPADPSQYMDPQVPELSGGGNAVNGALAMSNINDFYTGAGPDLGALEFGCPTPGFGPRPVGTDDSNQVRGCQEAPPALNAPPVNIGVSPLGRTGSPRVFTASATDSDGAGDLESISLLLGPSANISQSCAILVKRSTGGIYLYNDSGTVLLGPIQAGQANTLVNSQCSINGASSTIEQVASQNMVRVSADITFSASFRNLKNVYLKSLDLSGASSGWTLHGTWR